MTEDDIKYDRDGKPTSSSMERAFKENIELFNKLQKKHFTTAGTMKDNPLKDVLKDIMKKKGDKK
jgi:hypothetical protein